MNFDQLHKIRWTSKYLVIQRVEECKLLVHFDDADLKRRNGIEWVKVSCIQRHRNLLLQGFCCEWPTLFLLGSIGVFLPQIHFSIERSAATPGKNIQFPIKTRIIQIDWIEGSPWCTKPALSHFHRQKRGICRRVKRPLTRPKSNVRGVSEDPSLVRPLAGPKPTVRPSYSRCIEIKWFDEQIDKNRNEWTQRSTNELFLPQLSDANPSKRFRIHQFGVWRLAPVDPTTKSVE